ncbi:hypothetical protein [Ruegeria denitrificans]|uniref:hypothetical protein n=1 Tax=Ruegeria denitrificans TaxID=1715692 RepID=UPI00103A9CF6|nr:hypothetical protein [Ruegeria denitrificans]
MAEFLCENGSLAISLVHASLAKRMVVNYVTGCIDTSVLEADCRHKSLNRELRSSRDDVLDRMAGFAGVATDKEDSHSMPHHWSDLESNSLLKMLAPYNGFPLLLREETCQSALEWLGIEARHESQVDELQPSDQILMAFEDSPANKSEIKLRLFPDMSGREFDKHWWAASQINPSLSAPGRKASSDN